MSRIRCLVSGSLEARALLALAAALILVAPACSGSTKPSKAKGPSTSPSGSPKFLPPGGIRKIVRNAGVTVKVVVYGGSGEINDKNSSIKPHAGNHFTAVKVGLRNMGSAVYSRNLVLTSSITNDEGDVFRAVALGQKGLSKVSLKKDETAYGRIFFELRDQTRLQSVRFRPFGSAGKVAVFVIRGGDNSNTASTKPLPSGGVPKVLRGRGQTVKAVVYGGSAQDDKALGMKPHAGNHFISVKIGIKNFGARPYAVNLITSTRITNTEDKLFRAVNAAGHGLVRVALAHGQTAYGRIFFELADGTRLRTVRFRPFGPKTKVYSFAIRGG